MTGLLTMDRIDSFRARRRLRASRLGAADRGLLHAGPAIGWANRRTSPWQSHWRKHRGTASEPPG